MDILDTKTDSELLRSIIAELAKARNEMACAKGDMDKASSRINFLLAVANTIINRSKE
jgi:hypothetical protein